MKEFLSLSDKDKQEKIEQISSFLGNQKEVNFAYIYGSFLDSEPITFRDIDIGVFLEDDIKKEAIFDYQSNLAIRLENLLKVPVDIKVLNLSPQSFLNNVLNRGRLLFCKDGDKFVSILEASSHFAIANEFVSKQSFQEFLS